MANSEGNERASVYACLIQINGENVNKKFKLEGPVVRVGRALNSDIRINSVNVSRNHFVLQKSQDEWILKDCDSQNGTYVNGRYMRRCEIAHLKFGDLIFLGPPSVSPTAFCFEDSFDERQHIWVHMNALEEEDSCVREHSSQSSSTCTQKNSEVRNNEAESSKRNFSASSAVCVGQVSSTSDETYNTAGSSKSDELKRTQKSINSMLSKKKSRMPNESSDSFSMLSKVCKTDTNSQVSIDKQADEGNSQSLLDVESDMLDVEPYPFSQDLDENVLCADDEGDSMSETESPEIKKAQNSEETHSKDLKLKLAQLSEEIKKLEESKSDLLKEYANACEKNKLLDQQLSEQKKFKEDMKMYETRLKNKFKDQIIEKLEEDLICNICTELLIKPVVLDCSHTFCEFCIKEWKRKKKQCPICRNSIQNETRVLVLDHFIDRTLETWTPDQKEKRKELIVEREQKRVANSTTPKRKRRRHRSYMRPYRPRRPTVSPSEIEVVAGLMDSVNRSLQTVYVHNVNVGPLTGSGASWMADIPLSDSSDSLDEIIFLSP